MILKMADIVGREDIVKKTVVLGVTGGIAAYKAAQLTSDLKKKDLDVHVIMTRNATEFVSPLTFETLSGHRVSVDTFDRNFEYHVQHVSLANGVVGENVQSRGNIPAGIAGKAGGCFCGCPGDCQCDRQVRSWAG